MSELPFLERVEQENRKVLSHYHKLQATFAEAISEIRSGACSNEDFASRLSNIESKLANMEEGMSGIGDYLSCRLDTKYYNEVRKDDSTIALQVFSIPELTEHILSFANILDIMAMEQVNKTVRSIIDQSPKFQIALCLKAANIPSMKSGRYLRYHSPLSEIHLPGLDVWVDRNIDISFSRIETNSGLPKVGSRWMNMLISQPPIKRLYCYEYVYHLETPLVVRSDEGFTVGDLYKIAIDALITKPCPLCTKSERGLKEAKNCPTRYHRLVRMLFRTPPLMPHDIVWSDEFLT